VWIFDRSLTDYEKSVPVFIDTILENKYVQSVFEELAQKLNRPIESIRNTYASPIFRLGIAYKVNINRFLMGQLSAPPDQIGVGNEEYRLTETARLLCEGKINKETFFLVNAIRFQALNSTLQRGTFNELLAVKHETIPLLLCLQILRELQITDYREAYITHEELPWITERTSQLPADVSKYAIEIISARASGTSLPTTTSSSSSYVDAWFKWFSATRVLIDRQNIRIGNRRFRALVLSSERSMIINRILATPPSFINLANFEERYKWAAEYIKKPSNLELYIPPKDPLILNIQLPPGIVFDSDDSLLKAPWPFAASFYSRGVLNGVNRRGSFLVLGDQLPGLDPSLVYEVITITFQQDGIGIMKLAPAMKSTNQDENIANIIEQL
jgi:hypothetical protein